jgi:hypothetical protein
MSQPRYGFFTDTDPLVRETLDYFRVFSIIWETYLSYLGIHAGVLKSGTLSTMKVKYNDNISTDIKYYR